jgi:hypothetical protein
MCPPQRGLRGPEPGRVGVFLGGERARPLADGGSRPWLWARGGLSFGLCSAGGIGLAPLSGPLASLRFVLGCAQPLSTRPCRGAAGFWSWWRGGSLGWAGEGLGCVSLRSLLGGLGGSSLGSRGSGA